MNKTKIKIDIVSDIVCPWCYIGKRRLEKAIDQLKGDFEVEVDFLPFELNPDMPVEGLPLKDYLSNKLGGVERYEKATRHVTQMAADEGLKFDFDRQKISPNTRNAHRLLWLARQEGRTSRAKEALMKSYFEEGVDLSNEENLIQVAIGAGLDESRVRNLLHTDEGQVEVQLEEQLNYKRGISGVPYFIINNQYGISGAQPTDVFVKVLTQIGETLSEGESCKVGEEC